MRNLYPSQVDEKLYPERREVNQVTKYRGEKALFNLLKHDYKQGTLHRSQCFRYRTAITKKHP